MRISLFALLLVFGACTDSDRTDAEPEEATIPFRIDGTLEIIRSGAPLLAIDIEIADNDSSRERGMMQRTGFPARTGMLFVFDEATMQQFWMGNTPLALDLVFIDADSAIVNFAKYAVPFSNAPLTSDGPAQFVLEMPAGWVDLNGVVEGDRVRWRRH